MVLHVIFNGLISPRAYQLTRHRNANTASQYQRSFFQHFLFMSCLVLVKCSSALFLPLASSELKSNELCPNPMDFQDTYITSFTRFFSNNVYVLELVDPTAEASSMNHDDKSVNTFHRSGAEGSSPIISTKSSPLLNNEGMPVTIPCKFLLNNVKGLSHVTLVTLQQRMNHLNFQRKCNAVLEFPVEWGDKIGTSCETEEVNHAEDKMFVASDGKFEIRITQKKIVKWAEGGKVIFELPYEGPPGQNPFLTAVFRVTKGEQCDLQVQQYYWTSVNDSSKCSSVLKRKLMHNVCGLFDCQQESQIIHELKESEVDLAFDFEYGSLPSDLDSKAQMKTIGYFLKGLLVPLLISLSATLGYLIWRKRAKRERLRRLRETMDAEGVTLGTQTQGAGVALMPVMDEEGNVNLIELEDDYIGEGGEGARLHPYSQDKPPTYESILMPPSYEQATQPLLPQQHEVKGRNKGEGSGHAEDDSEELEGLSTGSPPPPDYLHCTRPTIREEDNDEDEDDKCLDVADESQPLT